MARGRILDKDICESNSFAALKDSNSQLLCVLLTPWWDDHGKMIGDEAWIKGNIVRKLPRYTEKEVARCLQNIHNNLNVQWWIDPETHNKWLYWEKFDKFQTISDEKKTKDKLPSPKIPKNPLGNSGGGPQQDKLSKDKISRRRRTNAPPLSDEDFIKTLKTNLAYRGIDIDTELNKMDAWLTAHPGRKKTPRFIVAWLNKIEYPVNIQKPTRVLKPDPACDICQGKGRIPEGPQRGAQCLCVK